MCRDPARRTVLRTALAGATAGIAGCSAIRNDDDRSAPGGETPSDDDGPDDDGDADAETPAEPDYELPDAVGLETVAGGLELPLDIAVVPDADLRYVATQPGIVHVLDDDGVREEPLLDLTEAVVRGPEAGLLGIELHPDFAETRRLFVRYSAERREGTPDDYHHTFVLAEFAVDEDGLGVDRESEATVLEIPQPEGTHNSGDIHFGPDGYLYVFTGDGGGANDTGDHRPEDWYADNEGGNGQDTTESLLGGVLRIDVDADDERTPGPYGIPEDNPLVDEAGHRDEYFAWGMRNPWRNSFDGNRLFVGDVGQAQWEWVNLVERGGNYGWNVREGSHCFDASDRYVTPDDCPDGTPADVRGGEELIDPILEYPNERNQQLDVDDYRSGIAIVGGYVYRGDALQDLKGLYVFGDYMPPGELFVGIPPADGDETDPTAAWTMDGVPLTDAAADDLDAILSFGRDADGELFVLGESAVYRIVPVE